MYIGPIIYDYLDAKKNLRQSGYVFLRDRSSNNPMDGDLVWADIDTDDTGAWFLVFTAFPRITSPYVSGLVGTTPLPTDTSMNKLADSRIQTILNNGAKTTRTQWYQTSVEFGTVWATGDLNDRSTQYNEFEFPLNWNSTSASTGERFKRRWGGSSWTDWMTSASGGCSAAVGGWSNYYQQSCTQSWFAGCEGGPAINHRCAGGIQDRAEKLLIWAR